LQEKTFRIGLQGPENDFIISKGENKLLIIDS